MNWKLSIAAAAVAFLAFTPAAHAEDVDYAAQVAALGGDAKAGEKVYRKCKACHVVDNEKNRVGPHQVGVIGRPAGIVEGFKYSDAMLESGLVWDVPTLTGYLAAPKKFLKGTKMNFAGLKKEEDINNVITYIFEASGVHEGAATTN